MLRLTRAQVRKVRQGKPVELFRRRSKTLCELQKAAHGEAVSAVVCEGVRSVKKYRALVSVKGGKLLRSGEYIYGLFITVLTIEGVEHD